jgi:superfamily II DNA or RNA helicase
MTIIKIRKLDESFLYVTSDFGVEQELSSYFSFFSTGYQFSPKWKNKLWDGKIYLYSHATKKIHVGLLSYIEKFAKINDYEIELEGTVIEQTDVSYSEIEQYINNLNIHARGVKIEIRDYQIRAIHEAIKSKRIIILSPTSSGKSLILYGIIRWYIENDMNCLMIVPSTMLVDQMYKDFEDYSSHNGWNVQENCSRIYSGLLKDYKKKCVISTWQTLQHDVSVVAGFDVVCGDECHQYKANVVTKLLNNMPNTSIRIGTTGTLDGKHISELQLTGLFGKVFKVITTKELMDDNSVTSLDISCILLDYDTDTKKLMTKTEYQKELDWIVQNDKRNKFIVNLALSQQETTLILFQYVEKHGVPLHKMLKEKCNDREIHYISGSVDNTKRDEIRTSMNSADRMIKIWFGELYILIGENELVKLSDGSNVQSKLITTEHDIDNNWIKSKKLIKM